MPEGDTAYRVAHHLGRSLANRTVTQFELRIPEFATANLSGETITAAQSRGKHILLRIGTFTVHSHLGMDGSWRIVPPTSQHNTSGSASKQRGGTDYAGTRYGASRRRHSSVANRGPTVAWPAAHRIRALIATDAAIALGIDLPLLKLWPTRDEHTHLGWLGPDLLAAEPNLEEAVRRILADPDRTITAALLDQRNVAGLGNEYVTEMCFLRGMLPSTLVAHAGHVHEWLELGRQLMVANRDRVERTFTGDLRHGNWVFGRNEGSPCRRCGTPLVAGTHDSGTNRRGAELRESVWCPTCQR